MKLFLREHALLIAVQAVQFFFILSIYWLDGYRSILPALYAIFLGFFFLPATSPTNISAAAGFTSV
jgi:OmpR family two-component system sensor histidine kinase YxdK